MRTVLSSRRSAQRGAGIWRKAGLGLAVAALTLGTNVVAAAQPMLDLGRRPMEAFTPLDFGGHSQDWDVTQDANGIIYVANSNAINIYDGARWRAVANPEGRKFRSVQAADETIYVGAVGDLGYLEADEIGSLRFVSLLTRLPEHARRFGEVRQIVATPDGVFFQHREYLFRWQPAESPDRGEMTVWRMQEPESGSGFTYGIGYIGDDLYVAEPGKALAVVDGGTLRPLPGDALPRGGLVAIVAFDARQLMIVTHEQGLYLHEDGKTRYLEAPVSDYAKRAKATGVTPLPDGNQVLATLGSGAVVFDDGGNVLRIIASEAGLPDNGVMNAGFLDSRGGLWLPLNYGIARVEVMSPVEIYDSTEGMNGSTLSFARYAGAMYVGTSQGLFVARRPPVTGTKVMFEHVVPGIKTYCWALLATGDELIAATSEGLFVINENGESRTLASDVFLSLLTSPDGRFLYAGSYGLGLQVYERRAETWTFIGRIAGTPEDLRQTALTSAGEVWARALPTDREIVQRIRLHEDGLGEVIASYDTRHGLPPKNELQPIVWHGEVFVGTESGLFRYDAARDIFTAVPGLGDAGASYPALDSTNSIWAQSSPGRAARIERQGEDYVISHPVRGVAVTEYLVFAADGDAMWGGTADGRVIRVTGADKLPLTASAPVLVRRVAVQGWPEIFLGVEPAGWVSPVLPYSHRSLRFEYASPRFGPNEHIEYQTRLTGLETSWTPWSADPYREFTALREGRYRFEVQARDPAPDSLARASFGFRVLPPWYRTFWAYVGYLLVAVLTIGLIVRWRVHRSHLAVEELRAQVLERERIQSRLLVYQHKLRGLASQLAQAEEQARRSTAADLHDGVAQLLAACKMRVDGLRTRLQDRPAEQLEDIGEMLDQAIVATRTITLELSPPMLYDLGLEPALSWLVARVRDKLNLECELVDDGRPKPLDPEVRLALFQSVRELLQNVRKHAGVDSVRIQLQRDDGNILVTVEDDGVGFDPALAEENPDEHHGFGLFSIRERISLLGGGFRIDSTPGRGTRVIISAPVSTELREDTTA